MESRYACVEYLAKCASNSKTEKISSVGQEAFFQVMNYVSEATAPENSIRKLMLQCEGERDMQQEIRNNATRNNASDFRVAVLL